MASAEPELVEIEGRPVAWLAHEGMIPTQIKPEDHWDHPARCRGTRQAHAPVDFTALVLRYGGADKDALAVEASLADRSVVATLNDDDPTLDGAPGWKDDRIEMRLRESPELARWRPFFDWRGQMELAEHLEEHADEVEDGANLLEVALNLDLTRGATCKSAIRLDNGAVRLSYNDEVSSAVEVPRMITLVIPLFAGGPAFRLESFLRWRLRDGSPRFLIKPKLLDRAIETAFLEAVEEVRAGLEKASIAVTRKD